MVKTKSKVLMLVVAILLILSTMVNAQEVTMSLSSSSKLKESGTVTVNLSVGKIDAGEGINTVVAELEYDKEVFEAVQKSDITVTDGWTLTFEPSTNMLTLTRNDKITSAQAVLRINLTVKSTLTKDSATVTLKDIVVSGGRIQDGGTGDIDVTSTSVTIEKATEEVKQIEVKKNDSTTATKKIPQTGVDYTVVIAIALVMVVAVVSYVRYAVYRKDVK